MNHRLLSTIVAGLLIGLAATAAPVDREDALKKAQAFVSQRHGAHAARGLSQAAQQPRLTAASDQQQAYWYAFNVGQGEGFVIVSGDDRTTDILGYADKGTIDPGNMPDNLKGWLQGYADEMKYMDDHNIQANQPAMARAMKRASVMESIAPRMETRWDQAAPYNLMCPKDGEKLSVTGCVATAMAQVLYWHAINDGVNTQSTAIAGYDASKLNKTMEELEATSFDWNLMQLTYRKLGEGETEDSLSAEEQAKRQAVAKLMRYCGQSVQMNYSASASSATTANCAKAMVQYFGYDDATRHFSRADYSYTQWVQMVYDELKQRGPMIYHGQSTGGGHAFVCDGYDTDDYFHFNWGWSGVSDGYFKLSVLTPLNQGIGGSSTTDGFNYSQGAILNVNPVADDTPFYPTLLNVTQVECEEKTIDITKSFEVKSSVFNYTGETISVDFALALYQGDNFKQLLSNSYSQENLVNTYGFNLTIPVTLPDDLDDGIYTLYMVSKLSKLTSDDDWNKCENSQRHFVTAVVDKGQVTLTSSEPSLTATLEAPEAMVTNKTYPITVTLENSGNVYDNEIVVCFLNSKGTSIYETIGSKQVQVARGKSVKLTLEYTPTKWTDTLPLAVRNSDGEALVKQNVTITESGGSESLDLNVDYKVANLNSIGKTGLDKEGAAILGDTLDITATYTNPNATDFGGRIRYIVFEYEPEAEKGYGNYVTKNVYIPAGETYTLHVEHEMKRGWKYRARFEYYNDAKEEGKKWVDNVIMPKAIGMDSQAIYAYKADGTLSVSESKGNSYHVPNDITSIDLSGTTVTTVTYNDNPNPNTLYIVGTTIPEGLSGKNVIQGTVAEQIALVDGSDFAAPFDFTANAISYTRSDFPAATADDGWTTIVLPFNVSRVTANDEEIDWFHSTSDTGKRFWVKQFEMDGDGSIYFTAATTMKANTPYIIALPGSAWGTKWDLTDKKIVFHGTNAAITANARLTRSGSDYRFVGTTVATKPEGAYVLNDTGDYFERQDGATNVEPFRAYFTAQRWLDDSQTQLTMGTLYSLADPANDNGGVATAIAALPAPNVPGGSAAGEGAKTVTVYSLGGQPLRTITPTASGNPLQGLPKGLYIVNGKKMANP